MCRSSPEKVRRCDGPGQEAALQGDRAEIWTRSGHDSSAWREAPSVALGVLDQNRDVATHMLRLIATSKLDDPCSKRHQACVPAAKVQERFSSFFEEDCEDESEGEDDESAMVGIENAGRTEDVLGALEAIGRARDGQLASFMEPLVDEGASARRDAARLATFTCGAPLTFGA
eukprot:COSAG02_NODE_2066_length_9960_cov_3.087009_7_plen_173_part_00